MIIVVKSYVDLLSPVWEPNDCSIMKSNQEMVYCHYSNQIVFSISNNDYFDLFITLVNYASLMTYYDRLDNFGKVSFDRKFNWYDEVIKENIDITFVVDDIEMPVKDLNRENIISYFKKEI